MRNWLDAADRAVLGQVAAVGALGAVALLGLGLVLGLTVRLFCASAGVCG